MKVKKYQLILCLWVIIAGSIVFVFFREKLENNPNALKFEDHQFNDSINDTAINHNYYFKIGNKIYYQNLDTMFVYYPKNIKEVKTLMGDFWNPKDFINQEVRWRDVLPPFRLIKEKESDTLIIIKKGKRYIFTREKFK
jgi:hypothetical protein